MCTWESLFEQGRRHTYVAFKPGRSIGRSTTRIVKNQLFHVNPEPESETSPDWLLLYVALILLSLDEEFPSCEWEIFSYMINQLRHNLLFTLFNFTASYEKCFQVKFQLVYIGPWLQSSLRLMASLLPMFLGLRWIPLMKVTAHIHPLYIRNLLVDIFLKEDLTRLLLSMIQCVGRICREVLEVWYKHTYEYEYLVVRGHPQVPSALFLRQKYLIETRSLPIKLNWLASEPRGSSCLWRQSNELELACYHTQLYYMDPGESPGTEFRLSCLLGKYFTDSYLDIPN